MIRLVLAIFGVLFCGATGAFFLFVPPLLIGTALIALVALPFTVFMLVYCFGIPVKLPPVPQSDDIDRTD